MKRLLIAAVCILFCGEASAQIQLTTGDCSPIVNINLSDPKVINMIFGASRDDPERISEIVSNMLVCAREFEKKPKKKLELLIFAIDQSLRLKEKFLLPAYDAYLQNPDRANAKALDSYFEMTRRKIDWAIERYIQIDFPREILPVDSSTADLVARLFAARRIMTEQEINERLKENRKKYSAIVDELKRVRISLATAASRMPD